MTSCCTRRCVLLTSYCSPDRVDMHREIVKLWLEGSHDLDIYLVDSYGCGIRDRDVLAHPRFTQYTFSQEDIFGRYNCNQELRRAGPTSLERYSIYRALRDVPRLRAYQYIFKITCKYYFDDAILHAEYTRPLLVQDCHHLFEWQNSEIWGAPPELMIRLMTWIPRHYLMERFMADAAAVIPFERLPPIPLLDMRERFNHTTLRTL